MDAYTVVKRIGVGTYGSAYLVCRKDNPAQHFVLKRTRLADDGHSCAAEQAQLEVRVLSQLRHPLVLRYIDHFMYRGYLCIITEYCEAGDLYSLLRARTAPLPESQILEWLVQIVLAVQHVHAQRLLHRDLKTQNIFLTRDGQIRLGDFGVARPLDSSLDLARTIVGTPYYMSPEVMSNQPYGPQSDMWSVGCCALEMMTLKHAFDASDMTSLVCKIMRGEHLPIPKHFSPKLRDLAKALLNRWPSKRPTPEAILKLPWLRETVARVRDAIAAGHVTPQASQSPSRRVALTGFGVPGGPPAASGGLDRELEAAMARLAQIQTQRAEVAVLKERLTGGGAGPKVRLPPAGPAAPAAAGRPTPGSSPQPGQRPARAARGSSTGGIVAEHSGPTPRGHGVCRSSEGNGRDNSEQRTSAGGCGNGSSPAAQDPKARLAAKREQEIRAREAELQAARLAYAEERRRAEALQWRVVHGHSTGGAPHPVPSLDGHGGTGARNGVAHSGGSTGHPTPEQWHTRHSRAASNAAGAAEDFEEELQLLDQVDLRAASRNLRFGADVAGWQPAKAGERAAALRALCVGALGAPLTDLLYGVMRQHMAQGGDSGAFQEELNQLIGPERVQYLQLVDALIWCEDNGC